MDTRSLESLVLRAREGDENAYGVIVRRFQDMAVGYGYSILRDFQLAEDAAQEAFLEAYRTAYKSEPDAFAAAQFDAVGMLGQVIAELRKAGQPVTPKAVRDHLASDTYHGVVTTYRSDGKGNMAHEAEIVCFDGTDRIPKSTARYTIPPRS